MAAGADAVFFHSDDYARIGRRLGAAGIDLAVMFLALLLVLYVMALPYHEQIHDVQSRTDLSKAEKDEQLEPLSRTVTGRSLWGLQGIALVYYVPLRRLRGGTLGYRALRIRLVDRRGAPPGFATLVRRFVLAVVSVAPFGLSYAGCLRNPKRQAFHDKWTGTWLVKDRAEPAGPARVVECGVLVGPMALPYIDVAPMEETVAAPTPGP